MLKFILLMTLSFPLKAFDFSLGLNFSAPINGITLQDKNNYTNADDKLGLLSYTATINPRIELSARYKVYGFFYKLSLVDDLQQSQNNIFKTYYIFTNKIFEFSAEKTKGMKTQLPLTTNSSSSEINRTDLIYRGLKLRMMSGFSLLDNNNVETLPYSLSSFYSGLDPSTFDSTPLDFLYSIEIFKNYFAGDTAFVPIQRKNEFGIGNSLYKIVSYGLGFGAGAGLNLIRTNQTNLNISVIIGPSLNYSNTYYSNEAVENVFGLGLIGNIRMNYSRAYGTFNQHVLNAKLAIDLNSTRARDILVNDSLFEFHLGYTYSF